MFRGGFSTKIAWAVFRVVIVERWLLFEMVISTGFKVPVVILFAVIQVDESSRMSSLSWSGNIPLKLKSWKLEQLVIFLF